METWVKISETKNHWISNLGRVKWVQGKSERLVCSGKLRSGHYQISSGSRSSKNAKYFYVHRLVAKYFLGASDSGIVNHLDGDRTNNRADNLEWTSTSGNNAHSYKLRPLRLNPMSKLTVDQVQKIKDDKRIYPEIAAAFGISKNHVYRLKKGLRWSRLKDAPGE